MRKRNVDALAIKSGPTESGGGPPPIPYGAGIFWMPFFLTMVSLGITGASFGLWFLIRKILK